MHVWCASGEQVLTWEGGTGLLMGGSVSRQVWSTHCTTVDKDPGGKKDLACLDVCVYV